MQQLERIYGPILGLKLGNQKVVVISTYDLVKKVILRDEFNGRPDGFFFRVRAFGKRKGMHAISAEPKKLIPTILISI